MRVKIDEIRDALHPSEIVVRLRTVDGTEALVVDRSSVDDELLEIGHPIGTNGQDVLVELPRETNSGAWRVWIPRASLVPRAA